MEEAVRFNSPGGRLYGILHSPPGAGTGTEACLIMVVGGPQDRSGSHRSYTEIARDLCARGLTVLRFDYEGIGDSEGPYRGFAHAGPSLEAALAFAHGRFPGLRHAVFWSLCDGAAACMISPPAGPHKATAMILCNPYSRSAGGEAKAYLKYYYLQRLTEPDFWKKLLSLRFNPFVAAASFIGLAKAASQGAPASAQAAGTPPSATATTAAAPAPAPAAARSPVPAGLVRPQGVSEDPPDLADRVVRGLEAYPGPAFFILSREDLTALQFRDLYGSRKVKAPGAREWLFLDDADHTFSSREWKKRVCDLTFQAWTKAIGGRGR
jgi:hypothetical protein